MQLLHLRLLTTRARSNLTTLGTGSDLQELVVKLVFVADSIVLLKAGDETRVILQDHVLQDAALVIVEHALLAHL